MGIAAGKRTKEAAERFRADVREESCQTAQQPEARSTSDLRKRPRELTVIPEETAARKLEEKRLRAFIKQEEWVEVLARKNLWKQKRTRLEAVLMKPAEGVNYAIILTILNSKTFEKVIGASGTARYLIPKIEVVDIEPSI